MNAVLEFEYHSSINLTNRHATDDVKWRTDAAQTS